jgi:hypothetical protein
MAEGQHCIVDNTIDPNQALEGLTNLTESEAIQWLRDNQVELEVPAEFNSQVYHFKYSYQLCIPTSEEE